MNDKSNKKITVYQKEILRKMVNENLEIIYSPGINPSAQLTILNGPVRVDSVISLANLGFIDKRSSSNGSYLLYYYPTDKGRQLIARGAKV